MLHAHRWLAAGAMAAAIAGPAQAAWPERPITLIIPAAPGGTTDISARLIADKLSARLGQQIIVENRAGAAGIIGAQALARAKPDGYTLLMGNIGPNAINYALYKTLPYKAADFAPVTLVISVPNVLVVNEASPARSVADLRAEAQRDPSKVSFGSSGAGQSPHLSAELFKQRADIAGTHIPYKGAGPAVAALLGRQFTFMIDNLPSSMPYIQSGKLHPLFVAGPRRQDILPKTPTAREVGLDDFDISNWFGLFGPAGMPPALVDRISADVAQALQAADVREKLEGQGLAISYKSPPDFKAFIGTEMTKYAGIIKAAGLEPQ